MSAPTRDVQSSLWPDLRADKPVGPILPSVFTGTNAELMAAVAPYYLTGSVLDVTYGEGKWWDRYRPDPFTIHDLYKLDGVDFRALPEADSSADTGCFDPPYVPAGGLTEQAKEYRERYGLTCRTRNQLWELIDGGLSELARVCTRWVLVKCSDFVDSGRFWLGHVEVVRMAEAYGLRPHDLIVHNTGSGPGGHNIFEPTRARRHHSYLIVFGVA